MFRNLIKSAFRHLLAQKVHSSINLLGLSIGLATCLLIFLFVNHELSYDSFHPNADRVFRVQTHFVSEGEEGGWAATQGHLAGELKNRYPEVKASLRILPNSTPWIMRHEERQFKEEDVCHVDSVFFDVFDFPFLFGDKKQALNEPGNIVISESTAIKYFDTKNAVGKTLTTDRRSYEVSGVFVDIPENSHIHFDILIPIADMRQVWPNVDQQGPSAFYTYVKLNDEKSLVGLQEKTDVDIYEIMGVEVDEENPEPLDFTANFIFNPIREIHLSGNAEKEMEANSDIQYIYIFIAIALFVLLIAAMNYMNLATAQSLKRAKETGLRKVLGANRKSLFFQFMAEAVVLTLLSSLVAILIVFIVLPYFNLAVGKTFAQCRMY